MKLDLAGTWQFALDKEKKGIEQEFYKKTFFDDEISLPTTTAEAQKGEKGTERFTGYLTENYHFEGYAWYLKQVSIPEEEAGKRIFFSMERTRKSVVWVDGEKAGDFQSFYAEHRYELTDRLTPGTHTVVVLIDNTDYVSGGGHMTSPDTQTNWNGILGEIYLESAEGIVIDNMRIYPSRKERKADIRLQLSIGKLAGGQSLYENPAYGKLSEDVHIQVSGKLTRLEKKEGRDFEHFEPLYTQTAEVRKEWQEQEKGQDLPYVIHTLEVLAAKHYELSGCSHGETEKETEKDGAYAAENQYDTRTVTIHYALGENAREWDEYNPYVYELTVCVMYGNRVLCEKTSHFGLRDFTYKELTLYCNDKAIFLRGTHDAMIFPLTAYAPMDLDSWLHVYGIGREYGLNHYRYHTCCPPKAAFLAAAYLGIYIQAELAFWGSIYDAADENYNKAQQDFLLEEGIRALDAFGDMPSFFGMSMGNELWGSKEEINRIMGVLKRHDNRHLYTQGSNNHQFIPSVLPNDDFFSGVRFSKYRLFRGSYAMCDAPLGFVQTERPGAYWDYDELIAPGKIKRGEVSKGGTIQIQYGTGIKEVEIEEGEEEVIPHVPVVSHEIGQYEFTPDFREIELYTGVLQPENIKIFKERMEEKGLLAYADDYFRASGKLAADCYKLELEAAFRSADLSGFQLLDIKDYTGQGTALVGILNAFNKNKGAVARKDWLMFCSDAVLLPTLDSFVMKSGDCVRSRIKLRYYRPEALPETRLKATWYLKRKAGEEEETELKEIASRSMSCPAVEGRGLFVLGDMEIKVPECVNNAEFVLRFELLHDTGKDIVNEYNIFVYEESVMQEENAERKGAAAKKADTAEERTENGEKVCITNDNKLALEECRKGKSVLLFVKPGSMAESDTIKGEYCTDFWCYPMFRSISEGAGKPVPTGTMGLLIDNGHPALKGFASERHTTAQWYQIIENARPMILDRCAETKGLKPIVRIMDNFERNYNLGLLYEVPYEEGKMLVCHADLLTLKEQYPEAACLYRSLAEYVRSEEF